MTKWRNDMILKFAPVLALATMFAVTVDAPRARSQTANDGQAVAAAPAIQRINNPIAVFAGLDKVTGRIVSFEVLIDETVQFGALQVTPKVCYSRPLTEAPLTTGFTEVDEVMLNNKVRRIFSGWMFADSPSINAVDHPVYDVWLTDCRMKSGETSADN